MKRARGEKTIDKGVEYGERKTRVLKKSLDEEYYWGKWSVRRKNSKWCGKEGCKRCWLKGGL